MRKNKGKKYAFGIMAAWCLAVGAAALTGCGAKEADNKSRSQEWRKTA